MSFAVAGATGSGVSPGATATPGLDRARNVIIRMGAAGAVTYNPTVTITAPSAAAAADYQAGLMQNVLSSDRRAVYTTGAFVVTRPATAPPLRDGAPRSSGAHDDDFAENGAGHANVLGSFTASGSPVPLILPDTPGGTAWARLTEDPAFHPPWAPATLNRVVQHDTFRTWTGVRHRPTGCIRTIHHIDWQTNWDLGVVVLPFGTTPATSWIRNTTDVTEPNGNGSPTPIRGGNVPADGIAREVRGS